MCWICRCWSCSGVAGAVVWMLFGSKCSKTPTKTRVLFTSCYNPQVNWYEIAHNWVYTHFFRRSRISNTSSHVHMYIIYFCFCLLTSIDIPLPIWAPTQDAMYVFSIRAKYSRKLKYVGKRETFSFAAKKKKYLIKRKKIFTYFHFGKSRQNSSCLFAVQ